MLYPKKIDYCKIYLIHLLHSSQGNQTLYKLLVSASLLLPWTPLEMTNVLGLAVMERALVLEEERTSFKPCLMLTQLWVSLLILRTKIRYPHHGDVMRIK